jgi:hypothetical protein
MASTIASLPAGSRITGYISVGVVTKFFPLQKVHEVLTETNRASLLERDLPAHVVVYYVIALALYMRSSYREVLRCLLEGVQWLMDPSATVKVAGKPGISQARSRLGSEPLYRLITTILDPQQAPAKELAALSQERWETETSRDELKTHLRGAQIVLRSNTPELAARRRSWWSRSSGACSWPASPSAACCMRRRCGRSSRSESSRAGTTSTSAA